MTTLKLLALDEEISLEDLAEEGIDVEEVLGTLRSRKELVKLKARRLRRAALLEDRERIAEQYRSEGAGESARINGEKDRELKQITSEAYRTAQEIKGKADAEATRIYAAAYGKDPQFYRIVRTLEAYEKGLDEKTLVVFTGDQGMSGGHSGYWGMGDHTRPLTAFDWTMHVPLIFAGPGIPQGEKRESFAYLLDIFPTLCDLVGIETTGVNET